MSFFGGALNRIGRFWDRIRHKVKPGLSGSSPVAIQPYRTFGRRDWVFIQGRVLKDKGIRFREKDRFWHNFMNTLKRFNSDEIADVPLELKIGNRLFNLRTDQEGYFKFETALLPALSVGYQDPFYKYTVGLPDNPDVKEVQAEICIPGPARFGVISDIDDTVLYSAVTSRLKIQMLYLTFMKNAITRRAFREVSAFYRALASDAFARNPFFYVSNSPWNLYDLLDDFLRLNRLPKGPILLRDFGISYKNRPPGYHGHKLDTILRIIETYPELDFVLIGDSGERDADIYLQVAAQYPKRIKAIYIRDVLERRRARRIRKLIAETWGVEVLLVTNFAEAARHASDIGLLDWGTFLAARE